MAQASPSLLPLWIVLGLLPVLAVCLACIKRQRTERTGA